MGEKIEAKEIYCPECGDDYALAWSDDADMMYVVCGCGEAEDVQDFHDRFISEHVDGTNIRGYQ